MCVIVNRVYQYKIICVKKVILETENLYLRECEETDANYFLELDKDSEKIKYFPPPEEASNVEFQIKNIHRNQVYYKRNPGLGVWTAIEKENNNFAGWFALKHLGKSEDIEIAYCIVKEYRQKGFATNMAKTIIDYGFKQQNLVKILGLVKEENFASKKILEKIGMKFDEKKFYNEAEILFYSIGNQSI